MSAKKCASLDQTIKTDWTVASQSAGAGQHLIRRQIRGGGPDGIFLTHCSVRWFAPAVSRLHGNLTGQISANLSYKCQICNAPDARHESAYFGSLFIL